MEQDGIKLRLVNKEEEEIFFAKEVLKYLPLLQSAYDAEFMIFFEDMHMSLPSTLWKSIKATLEDEKHDTQFVTKVNEDSLYRMAIVLDHFDAASFLMVAITGEIIRRLMVVDIGNKKYDNEREPMNHKEVLAKSYHNRLNFIRHVLKERIGVKDLIDVIEKSYFTPVTSVVGVGSSHTLVITNNGVFGRVIIHFHNWERATRERIGEALMLKAIPYQYGVVIHIH